MAETEKRFSVHPEYAESEPDWKVVRDAYGGERVIKRLGPEYLPHTPGQIQLGLGTRQRGAADGFDPRREGQIYYDSYLARAVFPEFVSQTVESLVGAMLREPWVVQVPEAMDFIRERATVREETLDVLIARILRQIILYGRVGLLNDTRSTTDEIYIADYAPENIMNWDSSGDGVDAIQRLRLVVLDETAAEVDLGSDKFEHVERERYRLLLMSDDGAYTVRKIEVQDGGDVEEEVVPSFRGRSLDFIPFTFAGSLDLAPKPDEIPSLPLSRQAVTVYRGEADYRSALFLAGQSTLVIKGLTRRQKIIPDDATNVPAVPRPEQSEDLVIGQGAVIYLPPVPGVDVDAKYITPGTQGLAEMRSGLENDYKRAEALGLALLTSGRQAEAAETIKTRAGARTATLKSIAKSAASALEQNLKWAATWMNLDPDAVSVAPNLDFVDTILAAKELQGYVAVKLAGLPVSWRTLHGLARQGGVTKMTYEEEREAIEEEGALDAALAGLRGEPGGEPGSSGDGSGDGAGAED